LLFEDGHLTLKSVDGTRSERLDALEARLGLAWNEVEFSAQDNYRRYSFLLSPDGRKVAVSDGERVQVATLDGEQVVDVPLASTLYSPRFFDFPIAYLASWSPDGRQLVIVEGAAVQVAGAMDYTVGPRVVDLVDGSWFSLPGGYYVWGGNIAWSPDSEQVAVAYTYPPPPITPWRIGIFGRDGSEARDFEVGVGGRPTWSEDGRTLLYSCDQGDLQRGVCVIGVR